MFFDGYVAFHRLKLELLRHGCWRCPRHGSSGVGFVWMASLVLCTTLAFFLPDCFHCQSCTPLCPSFPEACYLVTLAFGCAALLGMPHHLPRHGFWRCPRHSLLELASMVWQIWWYTHYLGMLYCIGGQTFGWSQRFSVVLGGLSSRLQASSVVLSACS